MAPLDFHLSLFAMPSAGRREGGLEGRVKAFLESSPMTESLDGPKFANQIGATSKADYLLSNREFIAELKTLNGDPKDRVENRLRERFAQKDSPIVFGTVDLTEVVDSLDDSQAIYKAVNDLRARAVRRHLQKSNGQIASIRSELSLDGSAGILILLNESEPMIDAANIGYSIQAAMETVEGGYPEIRYIWAIIESHRIMLPGGGEGYPMLLIRREKTPPAQEEEFLGFMMTSWATLNGSNLMHLRTGGDWNVMAPVYDGGPPIISPYR